MKQYWNEVQPVDRFTVTMNGMLHHFDQKVITFLYQPLIGAICTSLYHTLWHAVEENRLWSEEWNHYQLMNMLGLNLNEIFQARLKLEGIGLLKTYISTEQEERTFIYELQPPLTAEQFFTDGMLNIYLFQKIGRSNFLKLKNVFSDGVINKEKFNDVTRSFQDVFSSMSEQALQGSDGHQASIPDEDQRFIHHEKSKPIEISGDGFDFDLLLSGLTSAMVPRRVFTSAVKEAIQKLAFLYSIHAIDMQKIVLSSLTAEQTIDIEEMRKAARDWYQMENDNELPQLINRHQPIEHRGIQAPGDSKESKLIYYLETTSPRQLLVDLSDGVAPAKSDLTAVEEVMFNQQIEPGVMNVLIHYVMLRTDMKLSRNYMETIASHWVRKKIKTVKDAMELARKEHRKYQEWASGKGKTHTRRKKPIRTEKLPDWFVAEEHSHNDNISIPIERSEELEKRRRRLKAVQEKYRQSRGEKGGTN